jgi:Uncharacterized protein conserved in cyanobacteria
MQLPFTLKPRSEPEADIAVVRFDPKEYADHHPTPNEIFLIIELADRTLREDRNEKAPLYARAGIPEYWVLDVNTQQLYVFREPRNEGYAQETVLDEQSQLAIIAFPEIAISVNQLFSERL